MFLTRTISGIVIFLLLFLSALISKETLFLFNLILALLGLYEFLCVNKFEKNILAYITYLYTVFYFIIILFFNNAFTNYIIILYIITLAIVYVLLYPKFEPDNIKCIIFGFFYVVFLSSFILRIRQLNQGEFYIWLAFFSAWGTDTMAYLTGMKFGKKKLSPVLSPKKSVEGAIGGTVGAIILALIYLLIIINVFANQFTINRIVVLLISLLAVGIASIISQFGDLFASAFKRYYGVKDYGNLIPGHGGILDRFDSVLFTAPIIYIIVSFF